MKKKILAVCALAAFSAPFAALAQQADERGMYIGGSIGQATAGEWCDTGGEPGLVVNSCDDKATAYKVFIGYRAHRHFAIEGTFLKADDVTASGSYLGVPFSIKADATAFGAAAVGILPVGSNFNLFAKLGFLSTDAEATVDVAGQTLVAGEDDTEAHYGFGATYSFSRNWGLRAEWERTDKSKIEMWSIGVQYRF